MSKTPGDKSTVRTEAKTLVEEAIQDIRCFSKWGDDDLVKFRVGSLRDLADELERLGGLHIILAAANVEYHGDVATLRAKVRELEEWNEVKAIEQDTLRERVKRLDREREGWFLKYTNLKKGQPNE